MWLQLMMIFRFSTMTYKATINDNTPFNANHIIQLEGEVGEKLGAKALKHWKDDYGGTVRAKLVEIEIMDLSDEINKAVDRAIDNSMIEEGEKE